MESSLGKIKNEAKHWVYDGDVLHRAFPLIGTYTRGAFFGFLYKFGACRQPRPWEPGSSHAGSDQCRVACLVTHIVLLA